MCTCSNSQITRVTWSKFEAQTIFCQNYGTRSLETLNPPCTCFLFDKRHVSFHVFDKRLVLCDCNWLIYSISGNMVYTGRMYYIKREDGHWKTCYTVTRDFEVLKVYTIINWHMHLINFNTIFMMAVSRTCTPWCWIWWNCWYILFYTTKWDTSLTYESTTRAERMECESWQRPHDSVCISIMHDYCYLWYRYVSLELISFHQILYLQLVVCQYLLNLVLLMSHFIFLLN